MIHASLWFWFIVQGSVLLYGEARAVYSAVWLLA